MSPRGGASGGAGGRVASLVGHPAPPFTLEDAVTGASVTLSDFAGSDTLVLFLRGTWCPNCRGQLALLRENVPKLERAGVRVVAIACQGVGSLRRYLEGDPMPFPVLADARRDAAKAYRTHYWLSAEGINLSQPALFILDRSHVVTFAHVGRNQRDLPVGDLLDRFLAFLSDE